MAGIRFKPTTAQPLNVAGLIDDLADVQEDVANKMLADYQAIVATWETEVRFQKYTYVNPNDIIVAVFTDSQTFGWVNDGTAAHAIAPRRAPAIAYPQNFTPKTRPRTLTSRPGGKSGPYKRWPTGVAVNHPGIEARHFDKAVTEKYETEFQIRVANAIRRFSAGGGF